MTVDKTRYITDGHAAYGGRWYRRERGFLQNQMDKHNEQVDEYWADVRAKEIQEALAAQKRSTPAPTPTPTPAPTPAPEPVETTPAVPSSHIKQAQERVNNYGKYWTSGDNANAIFGQGMEKKNYDFSNDSANETFGHGMETNNYDFSKKEFGVGPDETSKLLKNYKSKFSQSSREKN